MIPADFNPRSHKGSDSVYSYTCNMPIGISIHAPTRGATWDYLDSLKSIMYFNPRSHKGSDFRHQKAINRIFHFNPRSHKGSDTKERQW